MYTLGNRQLSTMLKFVVKIEHPKSLNPSMMPGPGRNGRQADTHLTERENDGKDAAIGLFP